MKQDGFVGKYVRDLDSRLTSLTAVHSLGFSCLLTVNGFAGFDFVCSA